MKTKFKLPKRILSLVLAFVMVVGLLPMSSFTAFAAATPTAYDGVPVTPTKITSSNYLHFGLTDSNWSTYNGYYGIRDAKELYGFAALVNGGSNSSNAVLLQDIVINSGTVTQSGSSAGTTYSWTPIGTTDNPFLGFFDGNGCTISGLYINGESSGVGLFGVAGKYSSTVANIQIKNLVLSNSYIRGSQCVGGIAGLLKGNFVNISNCQIASDVTVAAATNQLGGIAGGFSDYVFLTSYAHNIKNCVVYGKVVSEQVYGLVNAVPSSTISKVGAITGMYTASSTNMQEFITVTNCYFISGCIVAQYKSGDDVYTYHPNFGKGGSNYTLNSSGGCTILTSTSDSHTCVSVTHREVQATCQYPGLSEYAYCLICGTVTSGTKTATAVVDHKFNTATCLEESICAFCGKKNADKNPNNHVSSETYYEVNSTDKTKHNLKNKCCNNVIATETHQFNTEGICTQCAYVCEHRKTENGICISCGLTGVPYLYRYYSEDEGKVISSNAIATPVTAITSSTTSMSNGWYVLEEDVTISSRINISGTVNIILTDGCTLTSTQGITTTGATLNIYGQTEGTGTLNVTGAADYNAGIGGTKEKNGGTVTINGGIVTARAVLSGAGIGDGFRASGGTTVVINGGQVTATGGRNGAGIGGGSVNETASRVTINGGTIKATGGTNGAGIGGGWASDLRVDTTGLGATVVINGGSIKATGGAGAFGRGVDSTASNGTLQNASGSNVSLKTITLSGASDNALVTEMQGMDSYGITDVRTLDTNKLYFYMSSDVTATSFVADDTEYTHKNGLVYTQHLYTSASCTVPATCQYCGRTEGEAPGHSYVDGVCTVCGIGEDGVHKIYTAEQLVGFAKSVNAGTKDADAILMADIDLTGYAWTTICETGLYYNAYGTDLGYSGTFDGNGHVIKNITVTSSTTRDASCGLFGTVSGTIKNLGIENFTFVDGGYDIRTGAIVGQLITANGNVSNCYVKNATINPGAHVTGGIAGCVYDGTIRNCYVVESTISGSSGRYGYIVGDSRGDNSTTDRPGTVTNCYTDNATIRSNNVGNVTNCATKTKEAFASGEVTYLLNGSKSNGDLVWYQTIDTDAYPQFSGGTVYAVSETCDESNITSYSNNADDVIPHNFSEAGICSVCGAFEPAKYVNGVYEISNVGQLMWFANFVNAGNQSADAILMADIDLTGYDWTPIGLTAMGESVTDGYTGNFDGNGHVIRNVTFAAPTSAMAAGIFGTVQSGGTVKHLGVENLTFDNNSYDHRAGGIAGQLLAGSTISDCYVINSTVKASSRVVGGIVGMNKGTVKNCFTYNMTLAGANNRFGGISGDYSGGTLENCYTNYSALASSQTGTTTNCEAGVSAERFASGEIAYKLNGSTSDGSLIWYQTIDTDAYPQFEGGTVYKVNCAENLIYSNENTSYETHSFENSICTRCGEFEPAVNNNGVYEIYNAAHLMWFAEYVNAGNQSADAILMADIDMNGIYWTPIGTETPYTGTFNGGGYAINNLWQNTGGADGGRDGLIVTLGSGGKVHDLTVDSALVWGASRYGTNGTGVIAIRNAGTISKCVVKNSSVQLGASEYLGGIAGENSGTIENCAVIGCSFTRRWGGANSGSMGAITQTNNGTVKNCFSYKCSFNNGIEDKGAIAAVNNGTLENCYYYTTGTVANTYGTTMTEAQFTTGEVTYLLNGSKSDGELVWYQTLGTDAYPQFEGGTVYKVSSVDTAGDFYRNENENYETHDFEGDICTRCGSCDLTTDENGIYQIYTAEDLMLFAKCVNNGSTTANAKLMADIDMTDHGNVMIGTSTMKYSGTFDGNGKTLTVNLNSTEEYAAPFRYINGATIQNLTVDGTISTNQKFAAGLVAYSEGASKIEKCIVAATINSSVSGDGTHGGLVAHVKSGSMTIDNCGFIGSITGSSTHSCGGFVGWADVATTISNSYVAGTFTTKTDSCYTFGRNPGNITVSNSYYKTAYGTNNSGATQKSADQFASGEVTYLLNGSKSDDSVVWKQTLGTDTYPKFEGGTVYKVNCVENLFYSNENTSYETHSFENSICTRCGGFEPAVNNNGVYEIYNAAHLMWFAEYVNAGNQSADAILMADIDLAGYAWTTICETDLYYKAYGTDLGYSGTFDGNGHIIKNVTVTSSTTKDASCGLFGTVSGTIKNLGIENFTFVDGGKDIRTGAIVGQLITANGKVSNCYVNGATITPGEHVTGGIAGCVYDGTVENCFVVNSNINGSSGRYGYIVGDSRGDNSTTDRPGTVKNCYTDNATIRGNNVGNVTNCATKTTEQFASGEVAYLLGDAWGQTLGTDSYPVIGGKTVYKVSCGDIAGVVYRNENVNYEAHDFVDDVCSRCGTYNITADENGVYLIYTADDLMVFAKLVNAGNTSANAKLMADIDLAGYDWKPIGTYSDTDKSANAAYSGTFDGNYHVIKNLSVKVETAHETGLFGRVNGGGTIKNLGVVNAKVENTQGVRAGVIAGEIHNSTVTNVYTVGDITVTTSNANGQAGGIAGECASTTLTNCYTTYGYLTANTTATANNCYYMADTANSASAGTNLPKSAFTGGELTWKLNGSTSEGVWKQTLGTEAYPSFTGETVYYGYVSCDQMVYTNTPASEEKIHSWLDATCTAPKTCTVCGTTEGDALGHEGGEATCAIGAICDRCGEEYGDLNPDAHTSFVAEYQWYPYDDGTCYVSATLYCADCGGYVASSGGYAELTGTVDATDCLNPGSKTYTITLTMNGEEYTESKAFEVKSDNHVGQWDNGFCTACGGYQMPTVDPGEDPDWDYDDTYLIYNAGQLFWFANYVNNGNNGAAGKLMANIDLNPGYTFHADGTYTGGDAPRAWIPIGSGSRCYAGAFDGNGFTVSGAYTVSESSYVGLFGNTDYNYEIKNLGITNSYFAGADHVGGLAGYAYTYIYNCYVTDTVYVSGGYPTGGLVGYSGVEIHNSYAMADSLVGRNYGTVVNSYYLGSEDTDGIDGTTALTAEQFASGEAAYLLQSGVVGEEIYDDEGNYVETVTPEIWGQTIGTDAHPVLGGDKVYQVTNCKNETAYSNTEENGIHIKQTVTGKAPTCTEPGLTDGVICSACGEILTAQEEIPATGIHVDEDNSGRCDTCNCLMQPAKLVMASISLKGNIALNYYMLLSDEVLADSTAYMQFTMADGEIIQIPVSEGIAHERNGETYYVFSCAVNAKEMTDDVVSQFFYEGGSTKEHTYNVQTYAKHILANSTDEEMKDLVTAMLNYGAASQTHFGYNTDNMANAELAAPDYSDVIISGFNATPGQGTELAMLYSASLILKSETTLRFFFQVDSSAAFTATYNGQALEVKQRSGLYYVDVVGIAAKDLDEDVTITISDGTNTTDVSFNPMSYCQGVLNDTTGAFDQEMKDLVAALYLYNQAANVYFKES